MRERERTFAYIECGLRLACSLVVGGARTNVVLVLAAVLAGVYGAALRAVVRVANGTQEEVDGGELAFVLEEREAAAVGRHAVERGCARRRLRALHTQRLVALVELVAANLTKKSSNNRTVVRVGSAGQASAHRGTGLSGQCIGILYLVDFAVLEQSVTSVVVGAKWTPDLRSF